MIRRILRTVIAITGVCLGVYSLAMGVYAVASTRPELPSEPATPAEAQAIIEQLGIGDLYPFEHGFVETPHGRMHFATTGDRARKPILLLHGNPTWSFLYRDLMAGLADSNRLIAPDLIGFGLSEKLDYPREYSVDGHIEDVSALVESLDLRDLTLVVQDWGGPIGLGVWMRVPERVSGLVVLNTFGFEPGAPSEGGAEIGLRAVRVPLVGEQLVQGMGLFHRFLLRGRIDPADRDRLYSAYTKVQGGWFERSGTLAFPRLIPMDPDDPNAALLTKAASALEHRHPRTLIVWGRADPIFGPEVLEQWKRRIPDARVVELEGVGHYLPEEAPAELSRAVRAFLSERTAKAALDTEGATPSHPKPGA